ncbi:MAG: ABC transporter permease subunit [Candidatus Riflebacteria bacterium]|nr:ABC transporter permease subunit [Candidatus Riflebacteria bacterium]
MFRPIIQKQANAIYFLLLLFLFLLNTVLYAQNPELSSNTTQELTSLEQLENMRIGVWAMSDNNNLIQKKIPGAKNYFYFNASIDGVAAVKSNKIDCYIEDEPIVRLLANRNTGVKVAPIIVQQFKYGIVLRKNSPLTPKFEKVINDFRNRGILDDLKKLWLGKDDSKKTIESIPKQTWEGKNGTIKFYNSADSEPLSYYGAHQTLIGYEVHLVYLIAKELDMKVIPTVTQFDSLIPALQSGKADIVLSCMTITDERQQSVDMVPYYDSGFAVLVRDENSVNSLGLFESLKDSFQKTFIVENRGLLIFKGLGVTITISIVSGLLGFIFGFVLIIIYRKNNKLISYLIKVFVSIIDGIPSVVLLMVLYYVIFNSVNISPILVSVLAFTLCFGSVCFELIENGIQAVNIGQEEAAKALGYTEFQAFIKIVFPQAAKQFLPLLKREFISMVKMTSVVGYVSCIDLTKASDLIRARTMEAFFPLIATAIIYYIIAHLMIFALNKFEISLDPKRRERKLPGIIEKELI